MSIGTALLLGFYMMFVSAMVPSPCLLFNGLTTSLWVGLVMGDIPTAVALGASLELIYLGAVGASGGVQIQDEPSAVLVSVPLVMLSGLDLPAAIAVALPIGLLCAQLNNLQQLAMSIPTHMAERAAQKGDIRGIYIANCVTPYILRIFIRWLPVSILAYLGGTVAQSVAGNIPAFLTNALSAVGGVMPAVGFGIIIYTMGHRYLVPCLLAGFFLVQFTGVSAIGAAMAGGFLAFVYWLVAVRKKGGEKAAAPAAEKADTVKRVLTKKELLKTFWMWIIFVINCESWERKEAVGYVAALAPSLKKLYKDDKEGLAEALSRNMEFFNTETTFGAVIPGITLAMEEQKALGEPITGDAITAVKTGLMGPFAGIGDSIKWGLLYIVLVGLFIPGCVAGSGLAALMPPVLFAAIAFAIAWFMFNFGYKSGTNSAVRLLQSGLFADLIPVLTILGMFMIGALGATYVKVTTPIAIPTSNLGSFSIQNTLDSIAPGLLSLGTIFLSFWITKKFKNFLWTALIMFGIALVLGLLGIIA
ncbi:MAG: PTS system mannose/fructose/sorbose family transporter subunit IID [Lachnospiraceae bacterium]|jgi:PTS system mannose-specific IID component|nr:PTS system mannose/fructose/sorbose family transporter subunit IID [Lachnospiraceae bacterium]